MLLAGSVTPAALHSAYRLLASAGNSIPDSDGWPTEPTAFATWEDFYEDLSANHAGTTATDTLALLHIAKHNHGNIVERERHAAPFTFGLSLTRQLGRRWGLETGLEYTLLRSSTTMGEGSNYILRRQRVHYLGIPLRLSYRPIDFTDRLSLYASAGLTMHIPLSAGRRSYLVTDSIPLSIQAEQVSAPWRVELDASLGLQYRLTPHMSLYLAPSVSCFLPSNSAVRTTWSARPFTLSAPLGLRFTW